MSCCYSYFLNKSIANNYGTRTTYTRRHLFVPMISTGMQCLKAIVRVWLTSVLNEHFKGKWVVDIHISLINQLQITTIRVRHIRDGICSCQWSVLVCNAWSNSTTMTHECVERTFFLHRKMSCCYAYFLNKSISNNYGTSTTYTRRHLFMPMISTGMQCLTAIVRVWLTSVLNEHFKRKMSCLKALVRVWRMTHECVERTF